MSDDYQWHFDYTRLVRDTGFTFQLHRPKSSIVKNLAHIEIDKIIIQQDIALVDKNINTVLEYTLDNEQSSVLDQNFVKIFYISQLSVQYLLFCKKYLDNTVAHLKKELANNKEVINKLNRKIEEVQQDAAKAKSQVKELQSTLPCPTSTQSIPVFQCNQCPKAFSTEEYLLAHSQRRHESFGHGTSFQVETDKLQSEIKALKERLNNTEKFIHHEDDKLNSKIIAGSIKNNTIENALLTELQHRFEMLKMHVDNELRMLQTQKFDQGKYEKWFETFLSKMDCYNKEKSSKSVQSDLKAEAEECEACLKKNAKELFQKDHTTQTDLVDANTQVCTNCQKRESSPIRSTPDHIEDLNKIEKLEEMLQRRVSGSLEKLENQMQSFCDKMHEFEKQTFSSHRTTPSPTHSADVKVVPKPRKKWNPRPLSDGNPYMKNVPVSPNMSPRPVESSILKEKTPTVIEIQPRTKDLDVEEVVSELSEAITLPKRITAFDNSDAVDNDIKDDIDERAKESTSETDSEEFKKVPFTLKSKMTVTPRVKQQPLQNTVAASTVQQNRQNRIMALLNQNLVELGISSDWSTLPTNSYHRALNIVVQQSNLAKKTYSNYNHVRDRILKNVEEEIMKRDHVTVQTRRDSNATEVKPFRRKKAEQKLKMYATESETESESTIKERETLLRNKENLRSQPQRAYFDVIQEFSSRTKTKGDSSDVSADSEKDDRKIEQAKGVLKNFSSVGSLHKKKVLFNLKSSENVDQNRIETVQMHGEGSTSSIGSSVLDGSKVNLNEQKSGNL